MSKIIFIDVDGILVNYENICDIGLDGMIGGNGAYVEAKDKILIQFVNCFSF